MRKQNVSLIIGLSIPVLMVIFITVAINGPRWFSTVEPPRYDFLYITGQEDAYARHVVVDGRLTIQSNTPPETRVPPPADAVHIFVHDVSENESREIGFEEAQRLEIDTSIMSPDGFRVEAGRRGGSFIFDVRSDPYTRFLVKGSYSQKLNLISDRSNRSYYYPFRFVGWLRQ